MTGVVLCGGQSSRMGTDKGLLKLEARTWAQTALDKLAEMQLPVVLSVNALQYPGYADVFRAEQLVKDNETLDIHGPLSGVLSVHLLFPQEDLFILACDMPLMETTVMAQLITTYNDHPSFEAYIFSNNHEPEPLCGIYTARGLAATIDRYQSRQLLKHSMKFALQNLLVHTIPIETGHEKCFRNFNAHAELNGL
jgi:molybdopterin-guanine dinucleotide biosynthesis protein A